MEFRVLLPVFVKVKEHDKFEFFLRMAAWRKDSRVEPVAAHLHYVERLVADLVGH